MSSPELDAERLSRKRRPDVLFRLLDPAFGFFVWAAHFLVVYIAAAVACALGLGGASAGARTIFLAVLALVTLVAAAVPSAMPSCALPAAAPWPAEQRFRMSVTIGSDAIAAVAILLAALPDPAGARMRLGRSF